MKNLSKNLCKKKPVQCSCSKLAYSQQMQAKLIKLTIVQLGMEIEIIQAIVCN